MPTLLLVRHGQASFGAEDYDVLSATGVEQAGVVAAALAGGPRIDRVVSGSLGRQRETAEHIARATGCRIEIDGRWDEYDSDDILEHHSDSAVRQDRRPGAEQVSSREFQQILETALHGWVAAGPDSRSAESHDAFAARVSAAVSDLGAALESGQTAVVCTSGGVLGALCAWLLGVAPETLVVFNRVTVNAGITRLAHGRSGTTLLSFNEQAHLVADGAALLTYR